MSLDNKSSYYDVGGIATINVIKAKLTPEQYEGFLLGNIIKYACRAPWKHDGMNRDAEKITNYSMLLDEVTKDD